jgi:hypothetical protein
MMKKRVVSFKNESNKKIKAICIFHEVLSRVSINEELITKNEVEDELEEEIK